MAGAHQGAWPPEGAGTWLESCQLIIQENALDSREKTPIHFLRIVLQPPNAMFSQIRIQLLPGTGGRLFVPSTESRRPGLSPPKAPGACPLVFCSCCAQLECSPHSFHVNSVHPSQPTKSHFLLRPLLSFLPPLCEPSDHVLYLLLKKTKNFHFPIYHLYN